MSFDQKAYRKANKEKIAARKRAWYQANKKKIAAKKKAHYEANKDKISEYQIAWYQKNKEKIAAKRRVRHNSELETRRKKAAMTRYDCKNRDECLTRSLLHAPLAECLPCYGCCRYEPVLISVGVVERRLSA